MQKIGLLFGFVLLFNHTRAADTLITQLLRRIDQLQPKSAGVFPKGSIPSYRMYALNKDRQKADINGFYTGLTAFILRDIQKDFTPKQKELAQQIILQSLPVYAKFASNKNPNTYNFWPTDTPQIFPHSGWLNLFDKKQSLADDLDDTVIILLALNAPDSVARQVHALMQAFTNNEHNRVNNTFKDYRNIGAYSTWFGKKMPVDFDVCVLANILYFVQKYNLEWTAADSASLQLITRVIADKRHVTDAAYVSPHYSRLPNILYHLSRLMALKPIPQLEQYKSQLVEEAKEAMEKADNFMDEVILSTALLRWNVDPPVTKTYKADNIEELTEDESFSFFIANMASMLPDSLKKIMGRTGMGRFYYYCPAYNNVLFIENLVWRKRNLRQ